MVLGSLRGLLTLLEKGDRARTTLTGSAALSWLSSIQSASEASARGAASISAVSSPAAASAQPSSASQSDAKVSSASSASQVEASRTSAMSTVPNATSMPTTATSTFNQQPTGLTKSSSDGSQSSSSKLSVPAIAGIAVGAAVALILAFIIFFFVRRYKRGKRAKMNFFSKDGGGPDSHVGISRIRSFKGGAELEKERQAKMQKKNISELSRFDFTGLGKPGTAEKPVLSKTWEDVRPFSEIDPDKATVKADPPPTNNANMLQMENAAAGVMRKVGTRPDGSPRTPLAPQPARSMNKAINKDDIGSPQLIKNPFDDPKRADGVTKKSMPPPILIPYATSDNKENTSPARRFAESPFEDSIVVDGAGPPSHPPPAMPTPPLPLAKNPKKLQRDSEAYSESSSTDTVDTAGIVGSDDAASPNHVNSSESTSAEISASSTPTKLNKDGASAPGITKLSPTKKSLLSARTPSMHAASAKWGQRRAALAKGSSPRTNRASTDLAHPPLPTTSPFLDPRLQPLNAASQNSFAHASSNSNTRREHIGREGVQQTSTTSISSPTLSVFKIYDPERVSGLTTNGRLSELQ